MTRAVYIGGFGNGQMSAEGVGEALTQGEQYEDADVFTYSHAMDNPEEVRSAINGVDLYTHSAGILAARDANANPKEIIAVGAPIPTSVPRLLAKTGEKSLEMLGHSLTGAEAFKTVNKYNASAIAELARHPLGNLRHLRDIARANSIILASAANDIGVPTWLYYNDRDAYFQPTDDQQEFAKFLGVELNFIPGRHDQLPLYPAQTLNGIEQVHLGQ